MMNERIALTFTVFTVLSFCATCVFIYKTQIYGTAGFQTRIDEMSVESIFRAHNVGKTGKSTVTALNKAQEYALTRSFEMLTTKTISIRKNTISKDGGNSFDGENNIGEPIKSSLDPIRLIEKGKDNLNMKTVHSKMLENKTESPNNTSKNILVSVAMKTVHPIGKIETESPNNISENISERLAMKTVHPISKIETESTTHKMVIPPKLIDPYEFDYIINRPNTCQDKNLNMLIYVHSSPDYIKRRTVLRTTWANRELLTKYKMAVLFFMGYSRNNITMREIQEESEKYKDIIQENYLDSYRNLSLKGVSALKWIHLHCRNVQRFAKIDDDVLVNIFDMFNSENQSITAKAFTKNHILCNKYFGNMPVIRDRTSRWYVSDDEFPREYKFYPPYCAGMAFVMNDKAANLLYNASIGARFLWVDDYFITGELVRRAGLEINDFSDRYLIFASQKSLSRKILFVHSPDTGSFYKYWDTIQRWQNENVTMSVPSGDTTIAVVRDNLEIHIMPNKKNVLSQPPTPSED